MSLTTQPGELRFVVVGRPADGFRPNELARTMTPHPCMAQEFPFDPEYTIYNGRMTPVSMSHAGADDMYWALRRQVILRHTGELPLQISGPDAQCLLNRVMTRDISTVNVGRCSYQIACYHDGGMVNDGVLVRVAETTFWYVQADGDLYNWFRAHASGLDVHVSDPKMWVSQVQGPDSLRVLEAAVDAPLTQRFNYFDMATVRIAGQQVVVTRTGFSNELGWEVYLSSDIDAMAVAERIMEVGRPFGILLTSAEVFRARRIEAGLLNAGSDFGPDVTPFQVGLGHMVDFNKPEFIGKEALQTADRGQTTWGLKVAGGVARIGRVVQVDDDTAGTVCSSGWSPFQQCGVAIVRLDDSHLGPGTLGPGTQVQVQGIDGRTLAADVVDTPMYDTERRIPRGLDTDIPPSVPIA